MKAIAILCDYNLVKIERKFPLVIIDPPYGGILDKQWDKADQKQICLDYLKISKLLASEWLEDGGAAYIFGAMGKRGCRPFLMYQYLVESKVPELHLQSPICWKKRRAYGTRINYPFTREEIVYLTLGKRAKTFNPPYLDEKRTCSSFNPKYPALSEYLRRTNVWTDITEVFGNKREDAQKPIKLAKVMIETHTSKGDWVLDPCAGSGSTGEAAAELGRNCVLVERDVKTFKRMVKFLRSKGIKVEIQDQREKPKTEKPKSVVKTEEIENAPLGIFRKMYGKKIEPRIFERINTSGRVHGSEVRDFFIELARGRFAVDRDAEALLTELVEEGVLKHFDRPEPTVSQKAFIGLSYTNASYHNAGWAPGIKEHFYYCLA